MGAPWEAQEGAKLEQNRSWEGVFLKLKRQEYSKLFLNAFLIVLGAPWGSKNEHFALERLQKSSFRKLRFNIVLRPVLEGFWRPSWGQVGAKLGFIRVQNRI